MADEIGLGEVKNPLNEDHAFQLKLKAVEICANEMIEMHGEIDVDKVMTRSRAIYNRFLESGFWDYKSPWLNRRAEVVPKKTKKAKKGYKICPKCGDQVPQAWGQHLSGSKGKCGHKFTD
jgi:ABC-type tungstate transport system permease subunit